MQGSQTPLCFLGTERGPGADRYPSYSISRMSALSHRAALIERFTAAHRALAIQARGVTPEHLADAILAAAGNGAAQP